MRIIVRLAFFFISLLLIYMTGATFYAQFTDYAPAPTSTVNLAGTAAKVSIDTHRISILTWNIGYAGLGQDSDHVFDGGKQVYPSLQLTEKYKKGISLFLDTTKAGVDFLLLQEIDKYAARSHYQDQEAYFSQHLYPFTRAYTPNFKVGFVPLPWLRPIGKIESGLCTFSRYIPIESTRYAYRDMQKDWPVYLFFPDQCFLLSRFSVEGGKELVIINTQISTYTKGESISNQLLQLKETLLEEYKKGNFVIAGGDWSVYPHNYSGLPDFPVNRGDTLLHIPAAYPAPDWKWRYTTDHATKRSLAGIYHPDTTSRYVIDYFVCSPNIKRAKVSTLDLGFQFSDHQPVKLEVTLR